MKKALIVSDIANHICQGILAEQKKARSFGHRKTFDLIVREKKKLFAPTQMTIIWDTNRPQVGDFIWVESRDRGCMVECFVRHCMEHDKNFLWSFGKGYEPQEIIDLVKGGDGFSEGFKWWPGVQVKTVELTILQEKSIGGP